VKYNRDIHHRHSIRLPGYDYTGAGAYFVTVCTDARECLFGQIIDGEMCLDAYGEIALECWQAIPAHCPYIGLDAFVVMPNHIHGILILKDTAIQPVHPPAQERFAKPVAGSLPSIMRLYKAAVTRRINSLHGTLARAVWQRNYYEHIIRDLDALEQIRAYIATNPLRWEEDQLHPDNPSKW
jgi:REP element-mobilizing transposase RayT